MEDVASASVAAAEPLFQIVTRQDFSAATYLLEVRHSLLALAARPGQFVIAQSHERGERLPPHRAGPEFLRGSSGLHVGECPALQPSFAILKGKVNTIRQVWRNLVKQDETEKRASRP